MSSLPPPCAALVTACAGALLILFLIGGCAGAHRTPSSPVAVLHRAGAERLVLVAQQRSITGAQADPPWSAVAREWWSRLAHVDDGWWVVEQADLAPDNWRSP